MSITLQIKRGLSADLPSSAPQGELYYATDTNILYIGTGTSVVELNNGVNLTLTEADVTVMNFPATQPISGTVSVGNFPATQPVSGTVSISGPVEISDGTNVLGTSAHPVKTDPTGTTTQPISGTVSVSNLPATQPVSGTVAVSNLPATQAVSATSLPLPSGAATSAKQPAIGTAGTASADVISIQGIASMTPLKTDGSGVTQPVSGTVSISSFPSSQSVVGGGTEATALRVTIASDSTGVLSVDDNGSSLTVDGSINLIPATSGGLSMTHLVSAASTNATNVKGSAGQLYGWSLFNTSSSSRYVKIFNKATSPTVGTDSPVLNLFIPAGGGNNIMSDTGFGFSSGIGFAITSGPTDTDSGSVAANDVLLNLFYK